MTLKNSSRRYGAASRALHWGIAALVIGIIVFIELHGFFPKDSTGRKGLTMLHIQFGMLLFGLTALRLAWRAANPLAFLGTPLPEWLAGVRPAGR
jgi:cytochrome b561